MKKHKSYLVLFMLFSIILLFSLTSLVGVSKAKFTTEKNVNGFSVSTKQTVTQQQVVSEPAITTTTATGSAITVTEEVYSESGSK